MTFVGHWMIMNAVLLVLRIQMMDHRINSVVYVKVLSE